METIGKTGVRGKEMGNFSDDDAKVEGRIKEKEGEGEEKESKRIEWVLRKKT